MVCQECNREVRQINYRHLKSCCGLTPQQYRQKYPGTELFDPDVKKSCGLPLEKNPQWKGGISSPSCIRCGAKLSKHSSISHCRKCSQKVNGNPFRGMQHSEQTRAKMREMAQHRDPSTYKPGIQDPVQMSLQRKAWWSKLTREERGERLQTFIAAGQISNKKNAKTRIENEMAVLLSLVGRMYERNFQLGRYNVDFLVEGKIIVECYGDYWHCNPRLYQGNDYHKSLHMTASEKWKKDQDRVETFTNQGYRVVCFWEHDIYNSKDEVLQTLTNVFDGLTSEMEVNKDGKGKN